MYNNLITEAPAAWLADIMDDMADEPKRVEYVGKHGVCYARGNN